MKLIRQSFEILEQKNFTIEGIKRFIERCGRVCYKSEDRITDTSYEKFVDMLINRGHSRPLEFGTIHIKLPLGLLDCFKSLLLNSYTYSDQWIKYWVCLPYCYITINYRYYLQMKEIIPWLDKFIDESNEEKDIQCYPKRYTVHFIINRGIMDEFRTHVGLSHLAESNRYCAYNKDKFGNEVTFIIPNWINLEYDIIETNDVGNNSVIDEDGIEQLFYNDEDLKTSGFLYAMQYVETAYLRLLKEGCTPQQAREVLPLSVKSELISCGFKDAWDNFFYRRCDKAAHPMAREIALSLQEKFKELNYISYGDK